MVSRRSKLLYPLRIAAYILRLPNYIKFFETRNRQIDHALGELHTETKSFKDGFQKAMSDITILPSIDARLVNLQQRFDDLDVTNQPAFKSTKTTINNTFADNHEFDYFYKLFEDRFRGTENEIKQRVSEHLPLFISLPTKLRKLPIIDLGCGRGEFLNIMKENKLRAIGVDMNSSMVDRARKLGLEAEENDAFSFLKKQKTSSVAAITGFHLVEHIPFEPLMKIFEQSYRVLTSGGFALFETPNPQSLTVGANTFYLDPSHQRPIPPPLLAFMLETVGFKTELLFLHRLKHHLKGSDPILTEVYEALYGHGDYAVIGRKI